MNENDRFKNAIIYGTSHPEAYMTKPNELGRNKMAIDVILSDNKKVGVIIFYKENAALLEKTIKRAINTWHPEPPAELLDALAKLQEMQA